MVLVLVLVKAFIVFRVTPHSYLGMLSVTNLVFVSFCSVLNLNFLYIMFVILKDLDGKWGMRIESALSVRKVKVSFW